MDYISIERNFSRGGRGGGEFLPAEKAAQGSGD